MANQRRQGIERITLTLPDAMLARLEAEAEARGIDRLAIMREAIARHLGGAPAVKGTASAGKTTAPAGKTTAPAAKRTPKTAPAVKGTAAAVKAPAKPAPAAKAKPKR